MTATTTPDIAVLVFSKDRALQLECTLRTFFACATDAVRATVHVLYATSSETHALQYAVLAEAFPMVRFHPEIRFREDVIRFARTGKYILFMVDDAIFVRPFALADGVRALEAHSELIGFSYRLGRNIVSHYPTGTRQATPAFTPLPEDGQLCVDWSQCVQDFGYPLEVSSSLYRTADILPVLRQCTFDHPNTLEAAMDGTKQFFAAARPFLAFYEFSAAFCIPLNVVQHRFPNRHAAKEDWTAQALTQRFARGERLFPDGLPGFTPEACHQEVPPQAYFPSDGPAPYVPRSPFISVGVITYNRERLLGEALASALAQNYPHFEVVVVDDGSTDGTEAVVRAFDDVRLRYIHQENGGRAAASNRCIQEARGEYILWLDSDDVLLDGVLQHYADILHHYPDTDIVYGDLESVDAQLRFMNVEFYKDWYRNPEGLLAAMAFWNELPNPGTLVRRRCFEMIGLYAADFLCAQDYEWFSRAVGTCEFKHAGRPVCKWRHHDNGRATTGENLEFDCRIVEAMLAAHPLWTLCPDIDWARLPEAVCEGLACLKFADRFARLGCTGRALVWVRKALRVKAGSEINRLAAELMQALSQKAEQAGQEDRARQAVLTAINTPRAPGGNGRVLLVGDFFWPSQSDLAIFLGDLGAGLVERGFAVDVAVQVDPAREAFVHRGMRIFEFPNYMDPDSAKPGGLADIGALAFRGGYDAVILLAHPAPLPLPFYLLSQPRPRPQLIYLPIINREDLDKFLDDGFLPVVMRHVAKADTLVAITESSCDAQLIQTVGLPSRFIPCAVHDTPVSESFRDTIGLAPDVPLFLMVANYWPVKNHVGLIRCMRSLEGEWRLHIIGHPHMEDYFKTVQQAAVGDPRITVAGFTPRDVTAAAIRDADFLLLASRAEGCPMVILQAMNHGTPWLATPQCGSVRDQAGGVVVPLEYFPLVVGTVMQKPLLGKALGNLGRRHTRECFNITRVTEAFVDLIHHQDVRYDFRYPDALRNKNNAVVQKILQLAGLV